MIEYIQPVYRPPSEARSLILQGTIGCSHNRCLFCYMYRDRKFRARGWEEIKDDIEEAAGIYPDTRRVFLADGDAFVLSDARLLQILDYLARKFPRLERVSCYASPGNLQGRDPARMREMKEKLLKIIYLGVESGDSEILERVNKGSSPDQIAEGCRRVNEAGIKLSITVILGLAGRDGSLQHAERTAELVNRINPRFLSALTLMTGPHKDRFSGCMGENFEHNDAIDNVRELRDMIEGFQLEKTIFRSNHASNYLPLAGTLNKSREILLAKIDSALRNPSLHFKEEWMRGL